MSVLCPTLTLYLDWYFWWSWNLIMWDHLAATHSTGSLVWVLGTMALTHTPNTGSYPIYSYHKHQCIGSSQRFYMHFKFCFKLNLVFNNLFCWWGWGVTDYWGVPLGWTLLQSNLESNRAIYMYLPSEISRLGIYSEDTSSTIWKYTCTR